MPAKAYSMSEEDEVEKPKGLRISVCTGCVLALLAVVIAVGVGLIVHFVEKTPEVKCVCSAPTGCPAANETGQAQSVVSMEQCKEKAKDPSSGICTPKEKVEEILPRTVKPLHYDLELRPNMYDGDPLTFTFSGYVKIAMECLTPANSVKMHAMDLDITSGSVAFWVNASGSSGPEYVSHELQGDDVLLVKLSKNMVVGKTYFIRMNFSGPLTDDLDGFYLGSYNRGNKTVYLAATQFESKSARKAFPCFDEPKLKAKFDVTIVRKKEYSSISNMKIQHTERRDPGFEADVYGTTPIMSTYLLAFIVSDFGYINGTTDHGLPYRVWGRKEYIDKLQYALSVGERAISHFESYFNISFPLPKQDMIALPDFAVGAEENWGCITFRSDRLFYEEGVTSDTDQRGILIDITHELAHQWFGDLVTMEWWDDIWLNEGFATFFAYQEAEEIEPGWDMYNQFVAEEIIPVFEKDGHVTSHPITTDIFDAITYNKAASVLRMLKFFVGDETFRRGLSSYLQSRAYGNAKHDDLWDALHKQATEDHKTIDVVDTMKTWTLQMNYPVVTVSRVGDKQLRLQQSRFLLDDSADDPGTFKSLFNYKWNIPFTFTTSAETNFNVTDADIVWILRNEDNDVHDTGKDVPDTRDGSSWILGNVRHLGFYRVNYEDDNWRNIIKQLKDDHSVILPINRAQIVNDAIDLARAGLLDQRLALETMEYLSSELNYFPWNAAAAKLDYIDKMLRDTDIYGAFKDFVKASISHAFKHYGLQDPGTSHLESFARSEIARVACKYSNSDCLREARDMFLAWKKNPTVNKFYPELLKTVLCTGISEGVADDWYFLYDMYKAETSVSVKGDMMKALACSKESWLMDLFLQKAITPSEIRRGDATRALTSGPALNPNLQPFAWNFLRENYPLLRDEFDTSSAFFTTMVAAATDTLNTEFQLEELQHFMNTTSNLGIGESALKQALVTTKGNIKWMKTNYPVVKQWLTDLGYYKERSTHQGTAKQSEAVFLPKTVKPLHYDLEIKPNMYEGDPSTFTFEGHVRISLECLEPTSDVVLHMNKLTISSVGLGADDSDADDTHYVSHKENLGNNFLTVHASKKLTVGRRYYLKMNFTGPLKDDLAGFYLSSYKEGNRTVYLATTQFESSDARKAFPCFDEPALKSTFSLTIIRRSDFSSISNMPILRTENRPNGFQADIYQRTPIMSTYLVAFVVSTFGHIKGNTTRGLEFRVWARKDSLDELQYALDVGTMVTTYYEDYFKLDFPLPKQDMVAIPDFGSGAMENWGMITYREQRLFYKAGVTNNYAKQMVTVDITHELAHQWFGDLVTPKWWDDLWLNEGFATFVEYMGADIVEPGFLMYQQFIVEEMLPLFAVDGLVTSHPVYVDVQTVDEIEEIFDDISYNKGGTVLRMLRWFIGEQTFRSGLATYLDDNKYSNANHDDLWAALDKQAKIENKSVDVGDTMRTWTLQMNYPVVTVRRAGDKQLQLKQDRFLFDSSSSDPGTYQSPYSYTWNIPFTFTTSSERNFKKTDSDIIWMKRTDKSDLYTTEISLPDTTDQSSWIVGNIGLYGLYRVQYDEDNWRALIKQLNTDHTAINRINRAQIINDAWDFAKSEQLSQAIALQTVDYLSEDTDYYPWKAAVDKLSYVGTMLQNTELYGRFQQFMRQTSTKAFMKIGINDTGAWQIDSFARREIVGAACGSSSPDCVKAAVEIFKKWKQDDIKYPMYPELRKTIICTGLSEGSPDDWFYVYNKYKAETEISVKDDMLVSLGCSNDEWIIHTLLKRAITPSEIARQDSTRVIFSITNNVRGQQIVWNFIKDNWPLLRDEYSGTTNYFNKMITGSTRSFNTQAKLQEIEDFVSSTPNLGTGTRAFHQTIEQTKANIRWMEKNFPTVKDWLETMTFTGDHNTNQVPTKSEDIYLPKTVKPIHYDLELKPNMYEGHPSNFNFEGYVRISFKCLESTSDVVLHIKKIEITSGSVELGSDDSEAQDIHYVSHSENKVNEFLTIHASRELTVGRRYYLKMNYTGPLKDDLAGFYLSSYKNGNDTVYLATSHFESSDARKAFPCFDEPELKASFSLTLVRRKDHKSTSNMPILRTENRKDGFEADIYQTTPIMSTYLVAFVVSDFGYIQGNTSRGLQFRVWARKDSLDQLQYALQVATKVLSYYEDYFKIEFPLPKQDMVAIPDFAMGAMENWGMITYREQRLFYKAGVTNNYAKQMVTVDITHELAHQWFGDLVTPKWWDDLWLNEGFATFVEYMGADLVEPSFLMYEQFIVEEMLPIFTEDALATSHPIYVPVKTVEEIEEIFDDISYNKGGTVLRMLRFFIGEQTFQNGLASYLKDNIYSNADHDDLWAALDEQAKKENKSVDVGDTMRTWTLQMNYPVVTVRRTGDKQLQLKQERFLFASASSDPGTYKSPYNYKWNIPFTFTTSSERNFKKTDSDIIWIMRNDTTDLYTTKISLPDTTKISNWIVGNIGLYGFYRVQYDEKNWLALINQLNTDHTVLNRISRAQIINDAWDLAKSGRLSQAIAVKTVDYLSGETDYLPWKTAVDKLDYVGTMLQNTELYGRFQKFMREKSSTPFMKIGINDTGAAQLDSFARREIVGAACGSSSPECVKAAVEIFQKWKQDNIKFPMYPELRKVIICTGLSEGSPDDWLYVFNKFKTETEISIKDDILVSLGCSSDEWIIHTLLKRAITPSQIARADSTRVLFFTTNNARAQPIVWNFIKANWPLLRDEFSSTFNYVAKMITGSTRGFNTPAQLQEIEDFVSSTPNLGVGARAFHQAIEQAKANIKWMDENYPTVKSWLEKMTFTD